METLGSFLNPTIEFLQAGFAKVNGWQCLLIALFATVLMRRWAQLFAVAAGAALLYILVAWSIPIVTDGKDIKLPNVLAAGFWLDAASFFVGFVIVIAMFFAVKSVVSGGARGGGKKAKAH